MSRNISVAIALLVLAGCDFAAFPNAAGPSYLAENGNIVVPLAQPGTFEVLSGPGDAGAQFFCAAADYSYRKLGASPSDRVVLIEPTGDSHSDPGRRAASFALVTKAEAPETDGFFLNMREAGQARSVGHARRYCERNKRIYDFGL